MRASDRQRRVRRLGVFSVAALLATITACASGAGGSASGSGKGSGGGSDNLTISYSEKVGDELPVWIAKDAGIFKKNHLNVTLQYITGKDGIPALLSGQTQIASIGGSEALSAEAQGATLKYVLTLVPEYSFTFWTQPKYASASALKGQRIGITSTSGSLYIGTVLSLKQLGLSTNDVQTVPLGSVPNVNSALISGTVAAAASHPPDTYKFQQHGLKELVNLPDKHIPAAMTGFAVQDSYLSAHHDVVQRAVTSILQALQMEKSDKAYTEKEMAKYMGVTDPGEADYTYQFYAQTLAPSVPVPAVSQFAATKTALAKKDSQVGSVNLNDLVDPALVQAAAKQLGISSGSSG